MNEEIKQLTMVDQQKAEEKAQLSEEALNDISGGLIFAEEPIEYHSKGRVR